ncbi:MAG: hypothetical protein ACP5P1_12520 [Acidimicrobiales bacterium]
MDNHRKWTAAVIAVAAAAGIAAAATGVLASGWPSHDRPVTSPTSTTTAARPAGQTSRHPTGPLQPVHNPPAPTFVSAQQQADNAKIAASNDQPAEWVPVDAITLPAPVPSAQFPAVTHAARQDPDSYATSFVSELLNLDFATQTRVDLLAWAVSETSPDTMPGVPAAAAAKVLYADLDPTGSPIPPASTWAANAASGVTWTASDVTITPAPTWSEVLATGWQPPDVRMDFLDVTGNLTVTQTGHTPTVEAFSLQLGLGSAEYHDGYGAMSLNNWTIS